MPGTGQCLTAWATVSVVVETGMHPLGADNQRALPAACLSTCLSTYQRVHYGQHKREGDEKDVQPAGCQLGIEVVAGHDESHAAAVEDEGPNDQHKGQSFLQKQGEGRCVKGAAAHAQRPVSSN